MLSQPLALTHGAEPHVVNHPSASPSSSFTAIPPAPKRQPAPWNQASASCTRRLISCYPIPNGSAGARRVGRMLGTAHGSRRDATPPDKGPGVIKHDARAEQMLSYPPRRATPEPHHLPASQRWPLLTRRVDRLCARQGSWVSARAASAEGWRR